MLQHVPSYGVGGQAMHISTFRDAWHLVKTYFVKTSWIESKSQVPPRADDRREACIFCKNLSKENIIACYNEHFQDVTEFDDHIFNLNLIKISSFAFLVYSIFHV